MKYPFSGKYPITAKFGATGKRWGRGSHDGTDFGLPSGTHVESIEDGTVLEVGENSRSGKFAHIDSGSIRHWYSHLSSVEVNKGDSVKEGQQIAHSGQTGNTSGPHLHLTIWENDKKVDPAEIIKREMARTAPAPQQSTDSETHTIQPGDTFYDLEKKRGLPQGELQKLNPGQDPKKLQIGQKIIVRQGPPAERPGAPQYHTISQGDTFWTLENKYSLPHGQLQTLNKELDPKKLQIGQQIRIK